ncbi:MAG: hypothetical protein M1834_004320 [Cirrosporium novae-zelandiae]|nr:MAG: hypothetical protein M1834_004320 [Cirrosporium novae-zelandiae]
MEPRMGRRPASPGGRRLDQTGRASTGTLVSVYSSTYDPIFQVARNPNTIPTSPRASGDRIVEPRLAPAARPHAQYSPPLGQGSGADYVVRPRRRTLDVEDPRRPVSMIAGTSTSTSRRPVLHGATAGDRPRSPMPKAYNAGYDSDYYVTPASSGHQRVYSSGEDNLDVMNTGGDRRNTLDPRQAYPRNSGYGGTTTYPYRSRQPLHREPKEYDDYSYTGPGEQVTRDLDYTRPRSRADSLSRGARRERPLSMMGYEDYVTASASQSRRDLGPPPSTRGFDKIGRSDSLRQSSRYGPDYSGGRDYVPRGREDQAYDAPPKTRKRSTSRRPVSLYQPDRSGSYDSYTEDYEEARRRNGRRKDSYNEPYDVRDERRYDRNDRNDRNRDRSGSLQTAAAAVGLGFAAAKELRNKDQRREYSDEETYARSDRRDDRRDRRPPDDREYDEDGRRERERPRDHRDLVRALVDEEDREPQRRRNPAERDDIDYAEDSSGGDTRERGHHWRRHREHEASDKDRDDKERKRDVEDRTKSSKDNQQSDASLDDDGGKRERRRRRESVVEPKDSDERREGSGDRSNQPGAKSPTTKELDQPLKGILKAPTQKFPEDPNAIREGVAPLKDAGKKGIPPNARWTKIDRRLVNPEALDEGHERYEERPDYVIVLRVLTKDEIQKYADKTQEIRDAREAEWRNAERKDKHRRRAGGGDGHDSSDRDRELRQLERELRSHEETLSIEAPPGHGNGGHQEVPRRLDAEADDLKNREGPDDPTLVSGYRPRGPPLSSARQ